VDGLGATWARAFDGVRTEFWVGTAPASSGSVTVTMSGSGDVAASAYLLRGLTVSTGSGAETEAETSGAWNGPTLDAGVGQFVAVAATGSGTLTFPNAATPDTGWTFRAVTDLLVDHGGGYRIPSEVAATPHRVDAFSSSRANTTNTDAIYVIGAVAEVEPSLTLTATMRPKTAAFTLSPIVDASLTGTLQPKTAAFTAHVDVDPEAQLTATLRPKLVTFSLAAAAQASLAGVLRAKTGAFTIESSKTLTLAGTLRRKTGAFVIGTIPGTQPNRAGGRQRGGVGLVDYSPPIVTAPATVTPPQVKAVARAFGPVTMVGTQPTYDVTEASVDRDRDRIVVGGKDVTFFRGVPTPTPDYSLIEPLMYGSGRLVLPQIAATFEQPGAGALRWLRKGATVEVQRVRDGAVVATDYKAIVVDWTISGGSLSVQLGGEASGRAALLDRQPTLFPRRRDVGRYAFFTFRGRLRLPFKPYLGTQTGILAYPVGGMSELDYLSQLVATATKRNGDQWTIMPGADGAYRLTVKDRATIHATAYFDDAQVKPELRSDVAEEPNRIYATAVAPSGQKIKFGRYPGLVQGTRTPYPYTNTSHVWGEGTTNEDTDSGAGVRALVWRLRTLGYLTISDAPGGYDADVTDAVRDLQGDAGLTETGNVNLATWRALYDLDVTGYTLASSRIFPAAERRTVRKWNYTPTGSVIRPNPHFRPHRLPVEQTIDMGAGFTRGQARRFAKSELAHADTDNWVGTLDVGSNEGTMALIRGEHVPGGPLTGADVMQPRELRPGMNVWAPQFMGGTLFHVSGVEVSDGGASVRLALDTRARDTMKAWEVIARNRETRRHPARAWMDDYRSSRGQKDSLITWDEVGGILADTVTLRAGGWTVFPVVAGQEGTVARLRVVLDQQQEFAVAVFGGSIRPERLDRLVPAPLAKTRNDVGGSGAPWYEQRKVRAQLESRFMLYAAGTHDQPCGIGRARKVDGNGNETGAPKTGRFWDDSSFSYRTFAAPVLYVAIWTGSAAKVEPGRMFWPQLEEGS
jgi:hypothetical protein